MDIDFVVLWVDGNDPAWQAEKQKYMPVKKEDAHGVHRYRDWGIMQYWFRAIEAYAPWVRTVHFVTWGHLPPFLNTRNPKLHIVRHEDFMPAEALPTFSSRALEMNIHRIKGLAEHFVLFNDDMFLTRPMTPSDFFDEKTGLACAQFCELPCWLSGYLHAYQIAQVRSLALINKNFDKKSVSWKTFWKKYWSGKYPLGDNIRNLVMRILYPGYYTGFRLFHSPTALTKKTFEDIWAKEPDLLRQTTLHRFRDTSDVNPILAFYWQLASGEFVPNRIDGVVINITNENAEMVCRDIVHQTYHMLCVNDPSDEMDFDRVRDMVDQAFCTLLPQKCSFEQ